MQVEREGRKINTPRKPKPFMVGKRTAKLLSKERNDLLKMIPVPQWNPDTFWVVARDRGYRTQATLAIELSKAMQVSTQQINGMLETGRMTWGEVLFIGAFLEMTPKEFCDSFLHDYFRPYATDVYRAQVDNADILFREPRVHRRKINPDGDGWWLCSEERPIRGKRYLVTTTDGQLEVASCNVRRGYPPTRLVWTTSKDTILDVKAFREPIPTCKRKGRDE